MADIPGLIAGQTDLRGTYTITSSSANEPSYAPAGDRHTAFTGALLAAATALPSGSLDDLYQETDWHLHRDGHPRPRRRSIDIAGQLQLFGQAGQVHAYRRAANAGDADAMYRLAHLLEMRGETAEAEAETWYRRAADTGHPDAMRNLGRLFARRGETDEAAIWFRRAADTGYIPAMITFGYELEKRGETAEAVTWWRRAADTGGDPDVMGHLGRLLEMRGETAEAETWYRRAAEAGRTDH
ncbi:tetratricopeptide repeat protein [Nocardia stercoris]|uniref:tetratricopeptide repeat protein n=1 Tax=Nocardia stercoris TaxID=2483361 RepID=UPI001F439AAD|nr:tetratricopeptide repeat protein [Nocardia stercoris]